MDCSACSCLREPKRFKEEQSKQQANEAPNEDDAIRQNDLPEEASYSMNILETEVVTMDKPLELITNWSLTKHETAPLPTLMDALVPVSSDATLRDKLLASVCTSGRHRNHSISGDPRDCARDESRARCNTGRHH